MDLCTSKRCLTNCIRSVLLVLICVDLYQKFFFWLIIHASYSNRLTGNQNHQIGLVKLQNWASPWNP